MSCNKYVIPAGKLYFDPCPGTGERYFGETPGADLTVDIKAVEVYGSDDPVSELIADIPFGVARELAFKCINPSDDVIALFFGADPEAVSQASGSVTAEAIDDVWQGAYYQLGQSALNPTGVRGVSSVVVTDDAGSPTTFDLTDDYTVDLDLGRLYIVPGGGIANGTNLRIDYARAANARFRHGATPDLAARLTGSLRFIAANTTGPNRDIYGPRVLLRADGGVQVKRAQQDGKVQEFGFKCRFQKTDDLAALYIDGRAVAA
jgi:hypothetical protein